MPHFIGFVSGDRATGFTLDIPDAPDVTVTGSNMDSLSLRATAALREWAYHRRAASLAVPVPRRLEALDQRGRLVLGVHVASAGARSDA